MSWGRNVLGFRGTAKAGNYTVSKGRGVDKLMPEGVVVRTVGQTLV